MSWRLQEPALLAWCEEGWTGTGLLESTQGNHQGVVAGGHSQQLLVAGRKPGKPYSDLMLTQTSDFPQESLMSQTQGEVRNDATCMDQPPGP